MDATKSLRSRVGQVLIVVGLGVWLVGAVIWLGNATGLLPTIPYAGLVTTGIGAFAEAIGLSLFRGEPVVGPIEKRRTSLIVVVPAMLLFGGMLAGAVMLLGANFEQTTSQGRWIGSAVFLAISLFIFSALVRDVVLRFGPSSSVQRVQG